MSESFATPSGDTAVVDAIAPQVEQAFMVPQVNLLPATYTNALKLRTARLTAIAGVLTALLVLLLAWLVATQQRSQAQEELDIATAETARLQASAHKYADVPKVFAEVADAQVQLQYAMGNEVRWSFFLNDLALTMPSGVSLDSLDATAAAPGAASATDAAEAGMIGALNVSAKAVDFDHVANWLDALAKLPTLADPEALSMSAVDAEGHDLVGFESTAKVTDEALSHRYTQEGQTP